MLLKFISTVVMNSKHPAIVTLQDGETIVDNIFDFPFNEGLGIKVKQGKEC